MLVYKDGGPHKRAGGTYDYKVISDKELDAALAEGWKTRLTHIIDPSTEEKPKKAVKKDAKVDEKTDSE